MPNFDSGLYLFPAHATSSSSSASATYPHLDRVDHNAKSTGVRIPWNEGSTPQLYYVFCSFYMYGQCMFTPLAAHRQATRRPTAYKDLS